jgi:enamine deaminase RidA (YjgF/YER057c/UK114 family)
MEYCKKISYSILNAPFDSSFEVMVDALLAQLSKDKAVLRIVIFGMPISNQEYVERKLILMDRMRNYFGNSMPAISYVAQPSLDNGLIAEVHSYEKEDIDELLFCSYQSIPYIILNNPQGRFLFASGFQSDVVSESIAEQSVQVFKQIEKLLELEGFPIDSIVRQWNYIENITGFQSGYQNYQALNDKRGEFYAKATWTKGYPAATGIGASFGGILIDFDAVLLTDSSCYITAIDNKMQVAAHEYSEQVLVIEESLQPTKATPKFERAKSLSFEDQGVIYVSGTAAIRGEESLLDVGLAKQLHITMENIAYLIEKDKLETIGVSCSKEPVLKLIRVYLKEKSFVDEAKVLIDAYELNIPVSYLWANVCREELLIEIEGMATY